MLSKCLNRLREMSQMVERKCGKGKSNKKKYNKYINNANNKNEPPKQLTTSKKSNPEKLREKPISIVVKATHEEPNEIVDQDDLILGVGVPTPSEPKKYSRRRINNNWTKYETSMDNYDRCKIGYGANYEELLQMPVSSGYFQFKFEKTWGELNKPNDDIFALHAKSLYDGVMSIPFYERNDLKPSLFNEEHINRMNKAAELNRKQYEHNLPLMSQEKELALKMTNLLRNEKPKFSEDTDTDEQQSASRIVKRTAFLAIEYVPGSAPIEDIVINIDIDQWLEEHEE